VTALAVKATIVFALALIAAARARRATSATRHAVLVAAQIVAITLPLLGLMIPKLKVEMMPAPHFGAGEAKSRIGAQSIRGERHAALPPSRHIDPTMLWALGLVAVATARLVSYVRAANVVRRSEAFGQVLISGDVDQPMTFGSYIVLPREAETWDGQRLRAVILHERAHVERRDTLLAFLGDIASALYWFHPLAWLTARRAMLERERACDETVLANGMTPIAYAGALVEVARAMVAHHRRTAAGLGMADRSQLETRIRAILDPDLRLRAARGGRLVIIASTLVVAPLLAAVTPRPGEPDLLGDALASPFSEYIGVRDVYEASESGPDGALIARMKVLAAAPARTEIDFVADRARWALRQARDGRLVLPLIEALHDRDWRVRAYAAFGLAVARDRRATPALVALLDDDIWRVRAMATTALANTADPAASPVMRGVLDDDAWQVRAEAVRYFAAVGAPRELFDSMKTDRHPAVRAAAEEARP
jgi:beta-lactamase regulating signal transducer with metallopeptidase domain